MPDQSAASDEHALMQEITAPLASLPDDPVPEVADVDFPLVLRGYDRLAVDAYVKRTSQLVAELNASRSPQAAVRRALERVGEEVSGILQRAHETGEQITAASRREAEDRLEAARREADSLLTEAQGQAQEMVQNAERRLKELDAETDRIWSERHRIVEDARGLASQLLALAEEAIQRFPAADTGEHAAAEVAQQAQEPLDAEETPPLGGEAPPSDIEATRPFDTEATRPFDVEAESGLPDEPGAGAQNTVPIEPVDPGEEDDLLEHDAE